LKKTKDWLLLGLGLGMVLATTVTLDVVSHFPRSRPPVAMTAVHPGGVDGAGLGRAYAPTVVASLSEAWSAAADTLEKGKTMVEAQETLHETWQKSRSKTFVATVVPQFAKVLAEGNEPKDDAQRARVVALWREFARGLKGGR
jgi:hypothetical protein